MRIGMANEQLRQHLKKYTELVLNEIAKYSTADNKVVAEDGCVLCCSLFAVHGLFTALVW